MHPVRLAELVGTLSLASDAGQGMPDDAAIRAAVLAAGLAEVAGADEATAADAYLLPVLRYAGCTADADLTASVMGDKAAVQRDMYGIDYGEPSELLPFMLRRIGRDQPFPRRIVELLTAFAGFPKLLDAGTAHCEVGDRIAVCFGIGERTRAALFQVFERWNGKGVPKGASGEAIALSTRIATVAQEAEIGHRLGGPESAVALVRKRTSGMLDPKLAECFADHATRLCARLDGSDTWEAFLEAEPTPHRLLDPPAVDEALRALGDFADLQSRWFRDHSVGVATLAKAAAYRFGLDEAQVKLVECAAFVHDVGRVAITPLVWDAPRALTTAERERVRTHTFLTERILSRARSLRPIAELASLAHERLDGTGYHRRLPPSALVPAARVLAASDCFRAMCEDRPHRARLPEERAAKELRRLAESGAFDADAVEAVVSAAGQAPRGRRPRPGKLTEREVEVIRLLAHGLTNKEIATRLDISTKTAGNHLQHIFEKIGVTTRAAASLYAMQHGLL